MTVAPSWPLARPALGVEAILEALGPLPQPSDSPSLVILVGLPGAGKSTLARRLAPSTGAMVLESDALRRHFFARPTHSFDESSRLFGAIYATASRLLARGISVILDATNLKASDRRPAINVARTFGARLHIVHVGAPDDVIERRLRARDAHETYDGSDAGLAVLQRMRTTFEPPSPETTWYVDTGDTSAYEASVARIIVALTTAGRAASKLTGRKGGSLGGRP